MWNMSQWHRNLFLTILAQTWIVSWVFREWLHISLTVQWGRSYIVRFICTCCSLMACYISAGSCCSTQNVTRQSFEDFIMSNQKAICDIRWEETGTFQHILVNPLVVLLRTVAGMPREPHALPRRKRTCWFFGLQGVWLQVSVLLLHIATVSIFCILKNVSKSLCYFNISVLQRVIILTDIP